MRPCPRSASRRRWGSWLGQLVGAAGWGSWLGLLALSVEVGLGVLRELLEQDVNELVDPKQKWDRSVPGSRAALLGPRALVTAADHWPAPSRNGPRKSHRYPRNAVTNA